MYLLFRLRARICLPSELFILEVIDKILRYPNSSLPSSDSKEVCRMKIVQINFRIGNSTLLEFYIVLIAFLTIRIAEPSLGDSFSAHTTERNLWTRRSRWRRDAGSFFTK